MNRQRSLILLLIGLALADSLAAIDANAVTIALPRIAETFNVGISDVSLVNLSYTLGLILSLIPLSRVGDAIGHKKNFIVWGLIAFGISSALITITPVYWLLIVLRVIQGITAGILYTSSGALVAKHWSNTEFAFGVTAAFLSIGMLFGPIIGGLLADTDIAGIPGWRIIFLINIPLILLSYWLVKNHAEETDPNPILNKLELLPSTKLFKIRNFLTVSIFTSACMFCLASVSFISSFYLQDVLKLTATQAGLYLIPIPIGMAVFSVISGFFRNWRLGSIFGGSIITIGLFILSTVTPDQAYFNGLFWGYLLVSAGAGFMFTNTFAAGLGSISKHLSGLGSGYLNTLQQLGAFAGVAFVASFNLLSNYQSLYLALVGVGIVAIISAFFITNQQHEY